MVDSIVRIDETQLLIIENINTGILYKVIIDDNNQLSVIEYTEEQ